MASALDNALKKMKLPGVDTGSSTGTRGADEADYGFTPQTQLDSALLKMGYYTPKTPEEANAILYQLANQATGVANYLDRDTPLVWDERSRYQDQITGARNQLATLGGLYGKLPVTDLTGWYDEANSYMSQRTGQEWRDRDIARKIEGAGQSVMAFDADGNLSPWQTALNMARDATNYADARREYRNETETPEEKAARERRAMPQTAEEAKEAYGLDYDVEEAPFWSWLFGHPVYKKAKGVSNAEVHGLPEGASAGEVLHKAADDTRQGLETSRDILTTPTKTGDPEIDNWFERGRENSEAARKLAENYGLPTYAVEGSLTQQTTDDYLNQYDDMGFGQKALTNVGITAGDYALSLLNAGLTSWDALSGGRLSNGSGTASSVYNITNFAQNAASGLTGQAFNSMRESTNWLGRLTLDLEKTSLEMLLDRALGGTGSLAVMGIRVFGSGAQEAENRGEGLGKQVMTGAARAAVEAGTEMMSGIGGSWRGTGYGDAFFGRLDKWVASKTGSELLGTLAHAFGSEAAEEMLADILNPLADRIFGIGEATGRGEDKTFMGKLGDFLADVWGDGQILYDGLLGGLAGSLGGGGAHVQYSIQAKNLAVDISTFKAAQRIAGDNKLRRQFEEMTGVQLNEDEATAITQVAAYLTNVSGSAEGNPGAHEIENRLMQGRGAEYRGASNRGLFNRAFKKLGVGEGDTETLVNAYDANTQSAEEYARAVEEVYRLGELGLTKEQAKSEIRRMGEKALSSKLNEKQAEIAWWIGNRAYQAKEAANAETVDVKTEEGQAKLKARLAGLGVHAETAANVYEETQDIKRFAAEMGTAAALAAAEVDVRQLHQQQKSEGKTRGLAYLSDAQVAAAAEIGAKMRAERVKLGEQKAARFARIRTQAEEGLMPTDVQGALKEARNYLRGLQHDIEAYSHGLQQMREENPKAEESATYKAVEERLKEREKEAEDTRELIRTLRDAGGEKAAPRKGKKGRAIYAKKSGKAGGMKYKAVARFKLSKTQKSAARVADVIARITGLNIVIADFNVGDQRVGGEYHRGTGGTVYLNINASFDGKNITIASLSHELTHFLQEYAPEEYEELKQFILQEMAKNPEEFESVFRKRMGTQQKLSPSELTDEMVANACMTVLQNDEAAQRIVREHQKLGERIRDFILKFVDDLKAAFSDVNAKDNFELYREVRLAEGALDEIRERWLNAFAVATENLQNEAETKNTAPESGGVQFMKTGVREDGIEVYETSEEVKRLPWKQKKQLFMNLMKGEYKNRTARFKRNGHTYFARFEDADLQKNIYGDTDSDLPGRDAKINAGADGDIFDLVDGAKWFGGQKESGKSGRAHKGVLYWDYYLKTVQIDGKVFDLLANVRKKAGEAFTYNLELYERKDIEAASPPRSSEEGRKSGVPTASENSITDVNREVNTSDPVALEEFAEPAGVQYSIFVEDPETLQWLDEQEKAGKVVTTYKSFLEIDGKLYPPMASMKKDENGKWKMTKAMEAGRWEESVGDPSKVVVDPKNGRGYYILKKDNGDTVKAAYNPYQHSSNLMLNDQFTGAYDRPKLVTYECIIPESELTSGYRAQYAKDAVGVHSWKAGPVAGKLVKAKGTERQVYLSRWLKPVRKVPDAEVAQHYKKLLDGTDIAVPSNVVPPSLLEALEDAGVRIQYTKQAPKRERTTIEDNGQMRLQFQMLSPVEETDRLVAVHNKSVSGLRRMLKRGGVPFPSIAIKKAGAAHEGFGDVSIVFPRSTIDPAANSDNRLYSNDAWTPTEPGTEFDVGNTSRYTNKLRAQIGEELFRGLKGGSYLDESELAKSLKYSKGDLVEALKGINVLKYAYLHSIGKAPQVPVRAKPLDGFGKYKNEQLLDFFDALSEKEIMDADYDSDTPQKVADVLNRKMLERLEEGSDAWQKLKNKPWYKADNVNLNAIRDAYRNYVNNGKSIVPEYDYNAFDLAMRSNRELEEDKGYRKWLQDTFSDLVVDSGIRNDKDLFTPSGSRRSFKQLHVPATLENIVREMKKMDEKAIGGFGDINLRGAATKNYRSVEEMRKDSGKLLGTHVTDEVYDSYMSGFHKRLNDMVDSKFSTDSSRVEDWQRQDSIKNALLEAIRDCETKQQMRNKLRREEKWFPDISSLTDELWQLKQDVRNMPAPYFEAKPRRVVYPREALAYILPNSEEAADVVRELEANGYNVLVYEAGNEADRLAKLNSVEGAQFQTWNGDQAMLDEFSDVHPDFQRRIDEANELTEDLVKYFRNVTGENALEESEIRELMEQNLYNRKLRGDIPDSEEILETLSKISQVKNGKGRMQAFELMERILPHLDESTQQLWISRTEENRNEAFAKWYNKKHPSMYYPGYQPGDLFKKGNVAPDVDPWANLHKERGYLHKLINTDRLVEPELSMAKDFLARLNRPGGEVFYQQWDDGHNNWAPMFYSQLENVVNEWANEKGRPMPAKMAANAVIPWLRGRGVKAEEIRWSGLQPWLEGRKSVTKEELQAMLAENRTKIETKVLRSDLGEEWWSTDGVNYVKFEELLEYAMQLAEDMGIDPDTVDWEPASYYGDDRRVIYGFKDGEVEEILFADRTEGGAGQTQWFDYSTEGGTNYREILFKLPGLQYTNGALRTHWGAVDEDTGTIAHARIQDIEDTDGRRVLFVEEIQSDLHNAGAQKGYGVSEKSIETLKRLKNQRDDALTELDGIKSKSRDLAENIYDRLTAKKTKYDFSIDSIYSWIIDDKPFPVKDEDALPTIDELWATAGEALSVVTEDEYDTFRDARRISQSASDLSRIYEAEVKKSKREQVPDVPFAGSADTYHEYVMKHLLREAAEGGYDGIGWTPAEMQSERWSDEFAEGYRIEYDQNIPKFMRKYLKQWGGKVETTHLSSGEEVWYADINDEMRKSVLQVGQPMFQMWDDINDDTQEEEEGRWEAYSRMQAEQAILDEAMTGVRELTRREKKNLAEIQKRLRIGKDPEVRLKDAKRLAKQLIKDQNSTADVDEIAADIKYMGDYLLQSGDPTTTVLNELARDTAEKIATTAREIVDENENEVLKNIRDSIKGKKLTVNPAEVGDIGGVESLAEFRKQNFGRFTVASRDGKAASGAGYVSVEDFYDELTGEFGDHYFPEAGSDRGPANGGEMLRIIADMYEAAEPMTVNPNEQYMGEAIESIAHDISFAVLHDALSMEPLTHAENIRAELLDEETELRQKIRQEAANLIKQGEEADEENRQLQNQARKDAAEKEGLRARNEELTERNRELRKEALQAEKEQKQQNKETAAEIRRLENQVRQLSKKLDRAAEKYSKLQNEARERVERVRREGTARAQERAAKERAKKYEKLAELKDHYQKMEQRARERRNNTKLRSKIRKLIDQLNARLARPTQQRHVPKELVQLTIDVLKMIDTDSGRGGVKLAEKLAKIRTMYESYEKNPTYSVVYDETTAEMLKNLSEKIGDGNIYNMSEEQLLAVYQALKSLNHVIETAVKIRIGNEEHYAFDVARKMTAETRAIPKAQKGWFREHMLPAHLRADVAFRRFAGFVKNSAWQSMARMLNDGQLKQTGIQMYLSRPFAELINNGAAMRDFMGMNALGRVDQSKLIDIGLVDENGDPILVSHGIALGIWMDLQNEDNRRHFIRGGKTVPNLSEYYNGRGGFEFGSRRAVGISTELSDLGHELREARAEGDTDLVQELEERIEELRVRGESYADKVQGLIEDQMTDFDRAWIDATRQLMNVEAKRFLNETTMEVYGIEKASVENYYPITTDKNFLNTPFETITKDMNLENAGFMKERVQSGNPTLALDISSVVNEQIRRVSQYSGLMPAIRNFNKVYNKNDFGYSDSLKNALNAVFGRSGTDYIENLIADLTGSRAEGADSLGFGRLLGTLRGNLAQTTLTLNVRVAFSQAASYPTAAAELGWGPLAKALRKGGKDGRIISRADQELIATYSPLLWLRMQGYSSVELGDIKNSQRLSARFWKKMRWATGWIQAVDGATVGRLWSASEYWVDENMPYLQKGSDEYYREVAKKFNDVVEKTQPNYTTMQRAAILRDPNSVLKTLTMFMTQRLQNFNIIYDNMAAYQKTRADYAARRNGVTETDLNEARTQAILAVTSQLAQAAVFVAFKFIADAIMQNLKAYRDDDDGELTGESISMQLLDNFIDALAGMFLGGSELATIVRVAIGSGKWYGLSLSGVDSLNDLIDSAVAMLSPENHDLSTSKGRAKFRKALSNFGTSVAQALGIPINNAVKIGKAVETWVMGAINGTWFDEGFEPTSAQQKVRDMEAAGIPKKLYERAMKEPDVNGNGSVTQEELGAWLNDELKARRITKDQANAIWGANGWKKTLDDWTADQQKGNETATRAAAAAGLPAVTAAADKSGYDTFKQNAPLYGESKQEASYIVWDKWLRPYGMTLERYMEILTAADTDGNGSLKQDELGYALRSAINGREMTDAQAAAVWGAQGWKTDFWSWSSKH